MENTVAPTKEIKPTTEPEIKSIIKKQEVATENSKVQAANTTTAVSAPTASTQSSASHSVTRNRNSKEERIRKKDDKSVDHVLKALNSLNTTEEKLAAMCKKYADIFDENRKVQLALKQAEKRCCTLQREKEQLQTDHSKAILTRSRLENLCRELQRQNKAIKDESLLKIREEEEKRKEVSAKFQATLNEITTLMQQNNDKNMKLRDDNIDMNAKLKNVCEQYELREQQVEKISKQMQLEAQLADAKLAKAKMEMAAEREMMLREKQQLLLDLSQYQARCQEFQATEINLRNQISMYDDKYDEFQKALARSNEVFGGFKGEMEKMSKKMCKLEKEVSTWKLRWEGSHRALLEMAEEKQKADQELSHTNRQLQTLQRLCRTLQSERTSLLAKLKGQLETTDEKNINVGDTVDVNHCLIQEQLFNGTSEAEKLMGESPKTSMINEMENSSVNKENSEIVNKDNTGDNLSIISSSNAENSQTLSSDVNNSVSEMNGVESGLGSVLSDDSILKEQNSLSELGTLDSSNSVSMLSSIPATDLFKDTETNGKTSSTTFDILLPDSELNKMVSSVNETTSVLEENLLPPEIVNNTQPTPEIIKPVELNTEVKSVTKGASNTPEDSKITVESNAVDLKSEILPDKIKVPSHLGGNLGSADKNVTKKEAPNVKVFSAEKHNSSPSDNVKTTKKSNSDSKKGKDSRKKKKNA